MRKTIVAIALLGASVAHAAPFCEQTAVMAGQVNTWRLDGVREADVQRVILNSPGDSALFRLFMVKMSHAVYHGRERDTVKVMDKWRALCESTIKR